MEKSNRLRSPPAKPASRFESVAVSADGRTVTATFYGGVRECYGYELIAKQSGHVVHLSLQETQRGGVCIHLAVRRTAVVTLKDPLAGRSLVDATTGATLEPR